MKKFVFCGAIILFVNGEKQISIVKKTKESKRQSEKLELFYVLKGKIQFSVDEKQYQFHERDMVLLHPGEWYEWDSLKENQDALVCKIGMDFYQFQSVLQGKKKIIICNSVEYPEKSYGRIRYIVDNIAKRYIEEENEFVIQSLYYTLWEVMRKEFSKENVTEYEHSERMVEILQYIQTHFSDSINLKDLSKKYFLSESALSRMFKKETGQNFVEYLRNIRLEKVRQQLLYTDKKITEIAFESGFSDISALNKNFKKVYGISPGNFRKSKYPENVIKQNDQEIENLKSYLKEQEIDNDSAEKNVISLDMCNYEVIKNPHLRCINVGMAADLLEAKVQSQVRYVVEHLGFSYIRISNIFDEQFKIRPKHRYDNLNFDKLDVIFDFLNDINVHPFIELPEKLQKNIVAIGNTNIMVDEVKKEVIKSLEEWGYLFEEFLNHMIERYTLEELNSWIFEINDDVECETGASKYISYETLYSTTYGIIRKYLQDAKIGGCGVNIEMGKERVRQWLSYCRKISKEPDFLSIISYPYQVEGREVNRNYQLLELQSDSNFVQKDLMEYEALLKEMQYSKTPIWITEWNTSLSERNIYNDSCAKACHMLKQMTSVLGKIEGMSYWNVSDCHLRYFDRKKPIMGAIGIITKDGLCKPSYFTYEFFLFVDAKIVGKGENYIVSKRNNKEYTILIFNPQKFNEEYRIKSEDELQMQELPYIFQDKKSRKFSFLLKNLENGKRKISSYSISEQEGNILSEWKKIGYLDSFNRSEIEYLKNRCIPRLEVTRKNVSNHNIKLDISLEPNELKLIYIS